MTETEGLPGARPGSVQRSLPALRHTLLPPHGRGRGRGRDFVWPCGGQTPPHPQVLPQEPHLIREATAELPASPVLLCRHADTTWWGRPDTRAQTQCLKCAAEDELSPTVSVEPAGPGRGRQRHLLPKVDSPGSPRCLRDRQQSLQLGHQELQTRTAMGPGCPGQQRHGPCAVGPGGAPWLGCLSRRLTGNTGGPAVRRVRASPPREDADARAWDGQRSCGQVSGTRRARGAQERERERARQGSLPRARTLQPASSPHSLCFAGV